MKIVVLILILTLTTAINKSKPLKDVTASYCAELVYNLVHTKYRPYFKTRESNNFLGLGTSLYCSVTSTQKRKIKKHSKIVKKQILNRIMCVAITGLNLREGPGSQFRIIIKLNQHDEVLYLSKIKSWLQVKVVKSGKIGYVNKKYVYL